MSTDQGYHYSECGLDVYIQNYVPIRDDAGEEACIIFNLPTLHKAIARAIVYSKGVGITGSELRFLRTELGMTPAVMASRLECEEEVLRSYEMDCARELIPDAVDRDVRLMVITDLPLLPTDDGLWEGRVEGRVDLDLRLKGDQCQYLAPESIAA